MAAMKANRPLCRSEQNATGSTPQQRRMADYYFLPTTVRLIIEISNFKSGLK